MSVIGRIGKKMRAVLLRLRFGRGFSQAAQERVVRAAFGTRRKTLPNALRTGLDPVPAMEVLHGVLDRLGIEHRARAEQQGPAALLALARALRDAGA